MNDIKLIFRPIHSPNHELEDTDSNTPPARVISKTTSVEFLYRSTSSSKALGGNYSLAVCTNVEGCGLKVVFGVGGRRTS